MSFSILEYSEKKEIPHMHYAHINSPFGRVTVLSDKDDILELSFEKSFQKIQKKYSCTKSWEYYPGLERKIKAWLREPWKKNFTFCLKGTPFQKEVWRTLLHIPFGTSASYGSVAKSIGRAKAFRAVGTAIGKNPIALLIPCHRVILESGHIGSYYWGNKKKASILTWEQDKMHDLT